jgi:hypothetical protein
LGGAALHGRFAHPDLSSILNANIRRTAMHAANEATSLTQGTGVWAAIGSQPLTNTAEGAMNPITPTTAPPGLPADLEALMRSLKMPHAPALGPELIATARAQHWDPAVSSIPPLRRSGQARRPDNSVTRGGVRILRARARRDRRYRPAAGDYGRRRRTLPVRGAAYEARSVAVSANLDPAGFDKLMPKTLGLPAPACPYSLPTGVPMSGHVCVVTLSPLSHDGDVR